MIANVINIHCVTRFKAKRHAPVTGDCNSPMALKFSAQGVQFETREIHILRHSALIKNRRNVAKPFYLLERHAPGRLAHVQCFEAAAPEGFNHNSMPGCRLSPVN